jgi:SAM-dependent methyltransferase
VERHGWRAHGVEVSPLALAFGRAQGWAVAEPPAAAGLFPENGFDVVTLIEVIEHLDDPVHALRQAVRWLRPGGLLYLTTPNVHSLNGRLLGPRWSIFCPPEHLTIWSPRGLRTALSRLGLRRVRLWTHGFNPVEILALLRTQRPDVPVDRQRAGDSLNRALSKTPVRRAAKRAANGLLTLAGVGDTLKARAEKPGRDA